MMQLLKKPKAALAVRAAVYRQAAAETDDQSRADNLSNIAALFMRMASNEQMRAVAANMRQWRSVPATISKALFAAWRSIPQYIGARGGL